MTGTIQVVDREERSGLLTYGIKTEQGLKWYVTHLDAGVTKGDNVQYTIYENLYMSAIDSITKI